MLFKIFFPIVTLWQVLSQTQDHRHRVLVAAAKNIKEWFIKVRKIKAIYHTLNQFNLDVTQKCLISECWCPVNDLEKIQMALRRGTVSKPRLSTATFATKTRIDNRKKLIKRHYLLHMSHTVNFGTLAAEIGSGV